MSRRCDKTVRLITRRGCAIGFNDGQLLGIELAAVDIPDVEGQLIAALGALRTEGALEARRLAAFHAEVTDHVPLERVGSTAARAEIRRSYKYKANVM